MSDDLNSKYRPVSFKDVIGQEAVIASLQGFKDLPPAILFSGPSGTGKTTLARILGASHNRRILEINAANLTGVGDMREVIDDVGYHPMDGSSGYLVIIDEVQRLSQQAFDVLLKPIEEPPPNVTWTLCSTEPNKIKKTILTRVHHYELKPVPSSVITERLITLSIQEKINLAPNLLSLISAQSHGSPRQAITYLSMCREAKSSQEVIRLIKTVQEPEQNTLELCRVLINHRSSWDDVINAIDKVRDEDLEIVRLAVLGYTSSTLIKRSDSATAPRMLSILHSFSKPFSPSEKLAPLILASGQVFFG